MSWFERTVVSRWTSGPLTWLVPLTLLSAVAMAIWPTVVPSTLLLLALTLAGLLVEPRRLSWFVVFLLACFAATLPFRHDYGLRVYFSIALLFLIAFVVLISAFRRTYLGVAGVQGESMLVDLRDRIQKQGELPELPPGWHADSALRSAEGTLFAGDFMVAQRTPDGKRFDVCVVDVSGKGVQAGTRALLLAGAFGGLIAAVEPEEFLPAANRFLLSHAWEEGFATAAHLTVDLVSGAFSIWTAGHPPPVWLTAGTGKWKLVESEGPVLGLIEDAEFEPVRGVMRSGDALMLYTDGLVETPREDISLGIDRLLGRAERLLRDGFANGAGVAR
jgi:hypothetical protein